MVVFLWHLCIIASRYLAFTLFITRFKGYFALFCALHSISMVIWINHTPRYQPEVKWSPYVKRIIAVFTIICYTPFVVNGVWVYYLITFTENVILIGITILIEGTEDNWLHVTVVIVHFFLFITGLIIILMTDDIFQKEEKKWRKLYQDGCIQRKEAKQAKASIPV